MVALGEAIVDSGSTLHLMKNDWIITSPRKKVSTDITTEGKSSVKAISEVGAKVLLTDGANSFDMRRILCVPDLRDNLLSVDGLCDDGHTDMFINNACTVLNGATIVRRVERKGAFVFLVSQDEVVWKGAWLQKMGAPRC